MNAAITAFVASLALGVVLVSPEVAAASGGSSIAAAPTMGFGSQLFGNSLTDGGVMPECGPASSWWLLPGTVGDRVVVDYEASTSGRTVRLVRAYPVGTTDFNYLTTKDAIDQAPQGNNKGELVIDFARTGVMPVIFEGTEYPDFSCVGAPGPYDFTARVTHKAVLFITKPATLHRHGTVEVQVHNPDGVALTAKLKVTLEAKLGGHWVAESSTNSVTSGKAKLHLAVPAAQGNSKVALRAVCGGGDYQTSTSKAVTVLVTST